MRIVLVLVRHDFQKPLFDGTHILAFCDPRAIGDAEDVSVDRDRRMPERSVENHVGGLAPHARESFECFARLGYFTAMPFDQ